jgi:phosphonate utilization transcriptional regulator
MAAGHRGCKRKKRDRCYCRAAHDDPFEFRHCSLPMGLVLDRTFHNNGLVNATQRYRFIFLELNLTCVLCRLPIVNNLQSCYCSAHPQTDSPMTPASAPTTLQLVQSNSLPALVHAEIEQLILRGELASGQRINESELAMRFGTSRGPIREALRALEESGLVRAEKHRGVFVREISVAEADEIYDIREALDQLIGQRVAERATPEQIRDLKAAVAEMDEATSLKDIKRYHALNLKFHDMIVGFAGNARLTETYRLLTKELLLFRLRGLQDGGGFAVSNTEHKAVVKAIAARDSVLAGELLRRHAAESRARMHKAATRREE